MPKQKPSFTDYSGFAILVEEHEMCLCCPCSNSYFYPECASKVLNNSVTSRRRPAFLSLLAVVVNCPVAKNSGLANLTGELTSFLEKFPLTGEYSSVAFRSWRATASVCRDTFDTVQGDTYDLISFVSTNIQMRDLFET